MDLRWAYGRAVPHGNWWQGATLLVRRFYSEPSGPLSWRLVISGASLEGIQSQARPGVSSLSAGDCADATIFDGWREAIFWMVVHRYGRHNRSPVKLVASARGNPYRGCGWD